MESFELLAGFARLLASNARLDEIVEPVVHAIIALGFGTVWVAVVDEHTRSLAIRKAVTDGVDMTSGMRELVVLDRRQPLGRGFEELRMINIADPRSLHIIERDDDPVPPGKLALRRASYERIRGNPFACGPLLGSHGGPVGALGLSSYRGAQPIPDPTLQHGVLRAYMDVLAIAMERAQHAARIERLDASLLEAQAAISSDARLTAVGELAGAVAHDVNHLVSVTLMATSVGARSAAKAVEAIPKIELANRAIGELVTRLQRIARPPSSEGETADLVQIVDDILVMAEPLLRDQSIEVVRELPAVPLVRCDPVLILQVVLNLVINARDALAELPADRRQIVIRASEDHGVVRLVVADTGPGIAPEVIDDLFTPGVTTKSTGHFGLGLASGRAALARFGGRLEGRNAPTGGAVFELTLGAAPSAPSAPSPADPTPEAPSVAESTRHARILAVDDDDDMVVFILTLLEPLGYEVSTATTSQQALDAVTSNDFDLVLCDVGMPKQSGFDVARALRARGFRGKVVLMTGWDTPSLRTDVRATECDVLLKKPFVGAELIRVIRALLGG